MPTASTPTIEEPLETPADDATSDAAFTPPGPSLYVTDAYYQALADEMATAATLGMSLGVVPAEVSALLHYECRLLDTAQWERWSDLFADELLYWLPSAEEDPRRTVSVMFDDRRRLLDRIARLRTGKALEIDPLPSWARSLSGLEVFTADDGYLVLGVLTLHERKADRYRTWVGRCEYRLVRDDSSGDDLKIRSKIVRLVDRVLPLNIVPII